LHAAQDALPPLRLSARAARGHGLRLGLRTVCGGGRASHPTGDGMALGVAPRPDDRGLHSFPFPLNLS